MVPAADNSKAGGTRPLVIAGTASGVGKTTVAMGLMGSLQRRGLVVAPFKVGPDYIDTGYHQCVTGIPSRNLDTWLTSPQAVSDIYRRGSAAADISIVEGVMGLFDGRAGAGDEGSTAEVARLVDGIVLLVADCSRMARSLAPVLAGFAGFDSRLRLGGVILNNVGSMSHGHMLEAAAAEAGVPVLGLLPRRPEISLGSRHLGLVPARERDCLDETLGLTADHLGDNMDLDTMLSLANAAVQRDSGREAEYHLSQGTEATSGNGTGGEVRLAVARDEAFSFYYVDSLEALEAAGASLVYFSPLRDRELPACDGVMLGGGFPEMFASGLEANRSMRESIAAAAGDGLPVYAECGGLVYLCETVEVDGRKFDMAGAIPAAARMNESRQALGYVEARASCDSILLGRDDNIRGHEFHWSTVHWPEGIDAHKAYDCYSVRDPDGRAQGYAAGNLLASYVHIHFAGKPEAAQRFVRACARVKGVGASAAG